MITYHLSIRNLSFLGPTVFLAAVQIGLVCMFHRSLVQVVWILCGMGLVTLVWNLSRVEWGGRAGAAA